MPAAAAAADIDSTAMASHDPNSFGSSFSFDCDRASEGSYSSFTCGGGGGGGGKFATDFNPGSRPAASGRTRPRMVKVRKQVNGRTKVASDGTGFNPFSVSNSIPQKCGSEGGDCSRTGGFVFGAPVSGLNDTVELSSGAGFSFGTTHEQSDETPGTSVLGGRAGIRASSGASCQPKLENGTGAFSFDSTNSKASTSSGCVDLAGELPDKMNNLSIDKRKGGLNGTGSMYSCPDAVPSFTFGNGKAATFFTVSSVNGNSNIHDGSLPEVKVVEDTDSDKLGSNTERKPCMPCASSGCSSSESFSVQSESASSSFEGETDHGRVNGDSEFNQGASTPSPSWVGIGSEVPDTLDGMPGRGEKHSCSTSSSDSSEVPVIEFRTPEWDGISSEVNGDSEFNQAASAPSPSWVGIGSEVLDGPGVVVPVRGEKHSFYTSSSDGLEVPVTEFKTPEWDPSCLKASLFPQYNRKFDPTSSTRLRREKKGKPTMGRRKHPSQHNHFPEQSHVKQDDSPKENLKSPKSFSPMDFSPYKGNAAEEQSAFRSNVESNDSELHPTMDSWLRAGAKIAEDHPSTDFLFGAGRTPCGSGAEPVCSTSSCGVVSDSTSMGTSQQAQFHCESELGMKMEMFSFTAGYSANNLPEKKHRYKKKYGRKPNGSSLISSSPNVKLNTSSPRRLTHDTTSSSFDINTTQENSGHLCSEAFMGNKSDLKDQVTRPFVPPTVAIIGACRLRGNQAYKDGDFSKAEDLYTQGINSVPSADVSACLKPLVTCYSNRAATRLSLGNIGEALQDCLMAASLDPSFLKAQMRAANCYLLLGEVKDALKYFNNCLEASNGVCLDRRITIEAAEGVQKAQKVAESIDRSNALLERKTPDASSTALEIVGEALSLSPHSEKLLQLKAEFLFMLRKYEEVIKFCEETLPAGEAKFASISNDDQVGNGIHWCSFARLWRWRLISKCYFNMGKLDSALDFLGKIEKMGPITDKCASGLFESSISLVATIRDLLNHKTAGNNAFLGGNYKEAVEQYSAALSSNIESRPFAAICFCNRAAAYQAMGHIADAIADCSLAVALDGNYSKAVSRRATLHEMIRDYGQSASDLQRCIAIRENRSDVGQSSTPQKSTSGSSRELKQHRRKLSSMEEEAKKGVPLDLYKILGVKESDSAADIKKAYRKAALRHHPDKAGQLIARAESGDGWKEIVDKVHVDADRLFKMIGEAYAVLSDSTKRSKYDLEEEIRKVSKENQGNSSNRRTATDNSYSSPFGSEYRRNREGKWKTYGYSYSRW